MGVGDASNAQRNGIKFIGTDGWIWANRDGISASDKNLLLTPLPDSAVKLTVSNDHMKNFFNCLQSRQDPISHVETGHRSAYISHLIIIALQTGKQLTWDPEKKFSRAILQPLRIRTSRAKCGSLTTTRLPADFWRDNRGRSFGSGKYSAPDCLVRRAVLVMPTRAALVPRLIKAARVNASTPPFFVCQ